MSAQRSRFEEWHVDRFGSFDERTYLWDGVEIYSNGTQQTAWLSWQAAETAAVRACEALADAKAHALPAPTSSREGEFYDRRIEAIGSVKTAIRSAYPEAFEGK